MPNDMKATANEIAAEILKLVRPDLTISYDPDKDILLVYTGQVGFVVTRKAVDDNQHLNLARECFGPIKAREDAARSRLGMLGQVAVAQAQGLQEQFGQLTAGQVAAMPYPSGRLSGAA